MRKIQRLTIFLASPGDVQDERNAVRQVVEEINKTTAKEKNLHLEVIGWDTNTYPAFGGDAQSLINPQIADMSKVDLFVGILWNRFGTPTPRAGSGTEEEFNLAAQSHSRRKRPDIWFYFSQVPATLTTMEHLAQRGKVIEFRQKVQKKGYSRDYQDPHDFERQFRQQLLLWLAARTQTPPDPPAPRASRSTPTNVRDKNAADADLPRTQGKLTGNTTPPAKPAPRSRRPLNWVYLNNHFFAASSVSQKADGIISLTITPRNGEDEAILREMRQPRYSRRDQAGFAHNNEAAYVQVESVETTSTGSATHWIVTLRPIDSTYALYAEMSYNGVTANEMARLRARLLLLNEKPRRRDNLDQSMLMNYVTGGHGTLQVEKGIFPDLWRKFRDQPDLFRPLARLYAVFYLVVTNIVEHILELEIDPIQDGQVPIRFRGQRKRQNSNEAPIEISVQGKCKLS